MKPLYSREKIPRVLNAYQIDDSPIIVSMDDDTPFDPFTEETLTVDHGAMGAVADHERTQEGRVKGGHAKKPRRKKYPCEEIQRLWLEYHERNPGHSINAFIGTLPADAPSESTIKRDIRAIQ